MPTRTAQVAGNAEESDEALALADAFDGRIGSEFFGHAEHRRAGQHVRQLGLSRFDQRALERSLADGHAALDLHAGLDQGQADADGAGVGKAVLADQVFPADFAEQGRLVDGVHALVIFMQIDECRFHASLPSSLVNTNIRPIVERCGSPAMSEVKRRPDRSSRSG